MEAIIQGEVHTSKSDKDDLQTEIAGGVDAVFHEGREDHIGESLTFGYIVFLSGALLLFWFISSLLRGPGLEDRTNLPYHSTIDLPLPDIYSVMPNWLILVAGVCGGTFSAFALYAPEIQILFLEDYVLYTSLFLKPVLLLCGPLLFSFILIIYENHKIGARNDEMANSIVNISEEEGYETVAVLCGESHREPIKKRLEDADWEVQTNSANSRLAKLF